MKDQITVTTIGTQYDEDHIVCITEEAREVLMDALYAEINSLKDSVKHWKELEWSSEVAKHRDKLRVAERLVIELDDMKVCEQ